MKLNKGKGVSRYGYKLRAPKIFQNTNEDRENYNKNSDSYIKKILEKSIDKKKNFPSVSEGLTEFKTNIRSIFSSEEKKRKAMKYLRDMHSRKSSEKNKNSSPSFDVSDTNKSSRNKIHSYYHQKTRNIKKYIDNYNSLPEKNNYSPYVGVFSGSERDDEQYNDDSNINFNDVYQTVYGNFTRSKIKKYLEKTPEVKITKKKFKYEKPSSKIYKNIYTQPQDTSNDEYYFSKEIKPIENNSKNAYYYNKNKNSDNRNYIYKKQYAETSNIIKTVNNEEYSSQFCSPRSIEQMVGNNLDYVSMSDEEEISNDKENENENEENEIRFNINQKRYIRNTEENIDDDEENNNNYFKPRRYKMRNEKKTHNNISKINNKDSDNSYCKTTREYRPKKFIKGILNKDDDNLRVEKYRLKLISKEKKRRESLEKTNISNKNLINNLKRMVNSLKEELESNKNENQKIYDENDILRSENDLYKSKNKEILNSLKKLNDDFKVISKENKILEQEKKNLIKENDELNQENNNLNQENNQLSNDLNLLKSGNDDIQTIQKQSNALNNENNSLFNQIELLNKVISGLQSENEKLTIQLKEKEKENNLTTPEDEKNVDFNNLKTNYDELKKNYNDLQEENNSLKNEKEFNLEKIKKLISEINKLQEINNSIRENTISSKEESSNQNNNNETVPIEITKLKEIYHKKNDQYKAFSKNHTGSRKKYDNLNKISTFHLLF